MMFDAIKQMYSEGILKDRHALPSQVWNWDQIGFDQSRQWLQVMKLNWDNS